MNNRAVIQVVNLHEFPDIGRRNTTRARIYRRQCTLTQNSVSCASVDGLDAAFAARDLSDRPYPKDWSALFFRLRHCQDREPAASRSQREINSGCGMPGTL